MAQSAVDLPDPIQQNTPEPHASADDLLAQLAGDEIDRLLAESHDKKPAAPQPAEPAPSATDVSSPPLVEAAEDPQAAEEKIEAQLDALFAELNKPESKPEKKSAIEPAPKPAANEKAMTIAEVDSAIESEATEKIAQVESAMTVADTDSAPAAAGSSDAAAPAASTLAAVDEETETSQNHVVTLNELAAEEPAVARKALIDEEETPLPLLLRPLEWVNAPFANLSESVREALGKVAILTLFNAVAVLIYVLIFR